MKEIAVKIAELIKDYRREDGLNLDTKHVLMWVDQFDAIEQEFLLHELFHILKQVYFSKEKFLECIFSQINLMARKFKFKNGVDFLLNVYFIESQDQQKSQAEILDLFYDRLLSKYGIEKKHLGSKSKQYVIYLDDVLATGKTAFRELRDWLNNDSRDGKKYATLLKEKAFTLIVFTICSHTWALSNVEYQFKKTFDEQLMKSVQYFSSFQVENHVREFAQKYNCVYPIKKNIQAVDDYFEGIDTGEYEKYGEYAFRKVGKPKDELFFSNSENRIRYENILLLKGIEILSKVKNLKNNSMRPLGYTVKSHKTFGLGTQFFTWRNVSNTTPLVFWWENHGWYPLFPVKNRGQNQ